MPFIACISHFIFISHSANYLVFISSGTSIINKLSKVAPWGYILKTYKTWPHKIRPYKLELDKLE